MRGGECLRTHKSIVKVGVIGLILLVTFMLVDLLVGMSDIGIKDVIASIFQYDGSKAHLILRTIRMPRVLLCMLVGAALSVAGLMMQNLTRNPLASPQILGINAGATLTVVIVMVFFPTLGYQARILSAFVGASIIGAFVYLIGAIINLSPLKITLVGISIQLFLGAITKTVMLFNESKTSDLVFWMIGGVHHAQQSHILAILPWFIVGMTLTTIFSKSIDILKMGDHVALSLGENIKLTKMVGTLVVILLASSAIAVVGPISFVGLITPHIVGQLGAGDFKGKFILCVIYGANLLLLSDILSKFLRYPYESPVGIVTALVGAAFYIGLANQELKRGTVSEK